MVESGYQLLGYPETYLPCLLHGRMWQLLPNRGMIAAHSQPAFMDPEQQDPKVTKLPRSGPRDGQSVNSYLHGVGKADQRWSQLSPQAGYDERKGRKLGRVQKGQIK